MLATILSMICISSLLHGEVNGDCPDKSPNPFYRSVEVNANTVECPIAVDCKGWYDAGVTASGIYPVKPDKEKAFQVYCDMETDGGGWTVLMRRQDGSVDFTDRNWADYEAGFGQLNGEFWLGLSKMHRLTPNGRNRLRVDLGDFKNNKTVALYSEFEILDATADYAIVLKNYSGSAGDSLYASQNFMKFTTKDNDNDLANGVNCATHHPGGGWWFKHCFQKGSRLTGPYYQGGPTGKASTGAGIIWYTWKGYGYSLKFAEMKTRRT